MKTLKLQNPVRTDRNLQFGVNSAQNLVHTHRKEYVIVEHLQLWDWFQSIVFQLSFGFWDFL